MAWNEFASLHYYDIHVCVYLKVKFVNNHSTAVGANQSFTSYGAGTNFTLLVHAVCTVREIFSSLPFIQILTPIHCHSSFSFSFVHSYIYKSLNRSFSLHWLLWFFPIFSHFWSSINDLPLLATPYHCYSRRSSLVRGIYLSPISLTQ